MKLKTGILLLLSAFLTVGCYAEMTGVVVDAETGAPIEGAVVLVEWTVNKGVPGLPVTKSFKVLGVISDREGKVKLSGVFNPSIDPPDVTVYKAGYVAWNNEFIFPGYRKRNDFEWGGEYVFKLEKYKTEYKHSEHIRFIRRSINAGIASAEKNIIKDAFEWEAKKANEETEK